MFFFNIYTHTYILLYIYIVFTKLFVEHNINCEIIDERIQKNKKKKKKE